MRFFKTITFSAGGDGLTQQYTVPKGARAINLQADGNVYEHDSNGKDAHYWPVGTESQIASDVALQTLYFTGDEGAKLHIRVITGLGG